MFESKESNFTITVYLKTGRHELAVYPTCLFLTFFDLFKKIWHSACSCRQTSHLWLVISWKNEMRTSLSEGRSEFDGQAIAQTELLDLRYQAGARISMKFVH